MSEREELAGYVEVWWSAVGDLVALLEQVPDEQWSTPTDLPGWDVRACAAHVAHLEARLAGAPEESADVGEPPHVTGMMGAYTEIGVVNRRDRRPAEILDEIRDATQRRHEALLADPPTDADARPEETLGGLGWSWRLLLRNRPLDVWMHEQDVRRAIGRPGGMDTPAAQHTTDYLLDGMGYVLAKRAGAPAGTSLRLDVDGSPTRAFAVGDDGRARPVETPEAPTVTLRTDRETFVRLAGGRAAPEAVEVVVEGDAELGQLLLERMATTP